MKKKRTIKTYAFAVCRNYDNLYIYLKKKKEKERRNEALRAFQIYKFNNVCEAYVIIY